MLSAALEAWTAFMSHLRPPLSNQVTLRRHRLSCKQCGQPLVSWYRTEAQFKGAPEEFLLLWRRLTGHVTFWKENKRTLPSEDSGNASLWKALVRCCPAPLGLCCRHVPEHSLAGPLLSGAAVASIVPRAESWGTWQEPEGMEASYRNHPLCNCET